MRYSQVVVGVSLSLYNEKRKEIERIFSSAPEKTIGAEAVYFAFHCVEWLEKRPEIAKMINFIKEHSNEIGMLRVGEISSDIEVIGDPYKFGISEITIISYPNFPPSAAGETLFKSNKK